MHKIASYEKLNKNSKNIIRGLTSKSTTEEYKKAFEKIKKYGKNDLKISIDYIRKNLVYKDNPVCRYFNNRITSGLPFFKEVEYELDEIIDITNNYTVKISILLDVVDSIYDEILSKDFNKAVDSCWKFIHEEGVSIWIIKILFYIKQRIQFIEGKDTLIDQIDKMLLSMKYEKNSLLDNAIKELINPRTNYFNIKQKIERIDKQRPIEYIVYSFINTYELDKDIYKKIVNSYFSISLIDSFLYICNLMKYSIYDDEYNNSFDITLLNKYKSIQNKSFNESLYIDEQNEIYNKSFFKESFLIDENLECSNYRTIISSLFRLTDAESLNKIPYEKKLIDDYFMEVNTIKDLRLSNLDKNLINTKLFNKNRSSLIENSIGLIYVLEKNNGLYPSKENEFITIMTFTEEIGKICPGYILEQLNSSSKSIDFKLVVTCLISIKKNSTVVEHEQRQILQRIVKDKFNNDFSQLFEYMNAISPAVTEHLIQMCDEDLLIQCYRIIKTPNMAFETRAKLLEWYGHKTDDSTYSDRARNFLIDIQINREKNTIDDFRIYVDSQKFYQWLSDNILNDLSVLIDNELESIEENRQYYFDWKNIDTGLTYKEQIAAIIQNCYTEFITNDLYGIASYLGRRIRHGTFGGTAKRDIDRLVKESKYKMLFSDENFKTNYTEWQTKFIESIAELKYRYLHINTDDKEDGLIFRTFNSPMKQSIANILYGNIFETYMLNNNNLEIPYVLTEYFWTIIEEDLTSIRNFLMKYKSIHGRYNYSGFKANSPKRLCSEFCRDLNSIITENFRQITSWFTKPTLTSPSADIDLLFRAVISEIKRNNSSFEPQVICVEDVKYNISGKTYFSIYDALFIIINNAAVHGKIGGSIELIKEVDRESSALEISIISEVHDERAFDYAKNRIETAIMSDCSDANVYERNSGVKKLKCLELDNFIYDVLYKFNDCKITASFKINSSEIKQ